MHLLDTFLSWENQQEHPDLESVKILERCITRFGMIRLQDFQKNAQQTTIRDFFKRQDIKIRIYVRCFDSHFRSID